MSRKLDDKLRQHFHLEGDDEAKFTQESEICHTVPEGITVTEMETGEAEETTQTLFQPIFRTRIVHEPMERITRTDQPLSAEVGDEMTEVVTQPSKRVPRGSTQKLIEEEHRRREM
ncbi:hypothetical protein GEMRC1_007970 [Eukaryota sp. GEM-RC1]